MRHAHRWIAIAGLALIGAAALTCSPAYVLRAGVEEARILRRRRPIADVVADPAVSDRTRGKLGLVLQARTFAQQALGLDAGESYTTYSWVESDTLLMVLSAARKDRFEPYTWWFPIVGRVPYKGYFDFPAAYAAAADLYAAGYDTFVRPSGAFSTLGWFNDPVLNTVLRYGDVGLVSTVIHELLHNTIFVPSHVSFNESFANFVGDRGAIEFFCAREGEASAECRLSRDAWTDNLIYGEFLSSMVRELERLYARTDIGFDAKVDARGSIFDHYRHRFRADVQPRLRTTMFAGFEQTPLNNATLIGTRLYYDRLHLFDAVYERVGRDLPAAIAAIDSAASRAQDPFAALERLVADPAAGAAESRMETRSLAHATAG